MQEQEESGMKLNSFASSGSLGSGGRGANSASGIKVTKEGGVAGYIDKYASVSKQTIQALRYLFKAGRSVNLVLFRFLVTLRCDSA